MVMARLIYFLHPDQKAVGIRATWLAKGFVAVDIVAFIIQAAGGAMIADQDDTSVVETGQKIYMAGIAVQLFFVALFITVTFSFHRNMIRLWDGGKLERPAPVVIRLIWAIYAVLLLIVVRKFQTLLLISRNQLNNIRYIGSDNIPSY
jgi:hypothetical protein